MSDMQKMIEAKSDQLNADDLLAGAITVKIRKVVTKQGGEQPCWIYYHGDNEKPWKPSKSMARVLVSAWGDDSKNYVDKSLTLYRDPEVKWAGMKVGGIRISHMSGLSAAMTLPLTETRGVKKLHTVKPLRAVGLPPAGEPTAEQKAAAAKKKADALIAAIAKATTPAELDALFVGEADTIERLNKNYPELADAVDAQRQFKAESLTQTQE